MDDIFRRVGVILPSLNPSDKFDRVVDGLIEAGFQTIVIVDDGSREANKVHFQRAAGHPEVTVLTHEVNRGKGAGLKTGIRYLMEQRPDCVGAVTIDGDGQHLTRDIVRCAEAMTDEDTIVMGCRDFSLEGVPARSAAGNRITSTVFRLLCGIRLSDTQTGLRGLPAKLFPQLLTVRGERFEYETNMLLELTRQGVKLKEVPIETVYEDDNSESHFRPIADSIKIYKFILLYALSSLLGALADLIVFYLFRRLFDGAMEDGVAVLLATVIARAVSSFLNFNLNKKVVFNGKDSYGKTMLRYYCLAVPQMLISAGLVALLSRLANSGAGVLTTVIKFVVDVLLFFISFRIQQKWVFKGKAA